MATTMASPRAATKPRPPSFEIVSTGQGLPVRCIIYGPEGVGKTSLAAYAPKPVFAQIKGESGLDMLIDAGQLPETPHFPGEFETWSDLLAGIQWLTAEDRGHETLVLDALDGGEGILWEHIRQTEFGGSRDKFEAYGRGYNVALQYWREFINALDVLRKTRRMRIILLAHSKVETTLNPEGEDYDRYSANIHKKAWPLLKAWADVVFFMNYHLRVDADGKASGGKLRLIHAERSAAFDAKNRLGLPEEIDAGNSGEEGWSNIMAAVSAARRNGKEGS